MNEELKKKIIKAQNGDKNALNEIVKENFGLIHSIGRRFENRGYEMEDIYQIGAIGMIKAIQKFDFSYNVMFSTFAVTYIIGEIRRFLRDDGMIKVSRKLKYLSAQIKEEKNKNEKITIEEMAKNLNVGKEEIIMAITSSEATESLESAIDDEGKLALINRINASENNEEKIVSDMSLRREIEKLGKKEKQIIYLRYYKAQTQKEVAKILGMNQVQVSRLEKKILRNLYESLKEA